MDLHRISIKVFLAEPANVDLDSMIGVFHGWIRDGKASGMLIDVADYRHMVDGPGVVLIGHDVDYALDMTAGRPGLLHVRKRDLAGSFNELLANLLHDALSACRTLEQEQGLKFDADQMQLTILDRLHGNDARLSGQVEAFVATLYPQENVSLACDHQDKRRCTAWQIKADKAPALETLIERVAAAVGA